MMLPDKALLVPAAFEEHIPSEDAAFCRVPLLLFLETQSDPGAMQAESAGSFPRVPRLGREMQEGTFFVV